MKEHSTQQNVSDTSDLQQNITVILRLQSADTPDLQIHRIIKENLHGGLKQTRFKHYQNLLPEVAKHTSTTERRADDAERDTDKSKWLNIWEKHMGEEFEA